MCGTTWTLAEEAGVDAPKIAAALATAGMDRSSPMNQRILPPRRRSVSPSMPQRHYVFPLETEHDTIEYRLAEPPARTDYLHPCPGDPHQCREPVPLHRRFLVNLRYEDKQGVDHPFRPGTGPAPLVER